MNGSCATSTQCERVNNYTSSYTLIQHSLWTCHISIVLVVVATAIVVVVVVVVVVAVVVVAVVVTIVSSSSKRSYHP